MEWVDLNQLISRLNTQWSRPGGWRGRGRYETTE